MYVCVYACMYVCVYVLCASLVSWVVLGGTPSGHVYMLRMYSVNNACIQSTRMHVSSQHTPVLGQHMHEPPRRLLAAGPDNHAVHKGLQAALGLVAAPGESLTVPQQNELAELYKDLAAMYPHSNACRRLPLDFLVRLLLVLSTCVCFTNHHNVVHNCTHVHVA